MGNLISNRQRKMVLLEFGQRHDTAHSAASFLIPYPQLEINVNHSKQKVAVNSNPQMRRSCEREHRAETGEEANEKGI